MASYPIYNPNVPYIGVIDGGFFPGKMVRIQGTVPISGERFAVNLQCGPNVVPRDDIALHINPRFSENSIIRNSLQAGIWGHEEKHGHMPLIKGQSFEIIVLCDPAHYKIAVNGQHYTEYAHRIPFQRVSHLSIDGDVILSLIKYEGGSLAPGFAPPPPVPSGGPLPYPTNTPMFPPAPPGGRSPSPLPYGYTPPPPGSYGYQQPPYGQPPHGQYPTTQGQYQPHGQYPPPPPGYSVQYPASPKKGLGGLIDKAGAALGGVMGHSGGKNHHGYGHGGGGGMGTMGTALGAGVAGAALTGHLSPKKALKANKKSHKKLLKYGIPAAGLGLGAYALHKGFHHHGSSSSSSSSSSEEE